MTCPPPVRELPNPRIEGGGAATLGPPPPLKIPRLKAAAVRCSLTDKRGAGVTTSLCPMLISPTLRLEALSILGAGATTEGSGASKACLRSPVFNSGAGAVTLACKFGAWRCDALDYMAARRALTDSGRPFNDIVPAWSRVSWSVSTCRCALELGYPYGFMGNLQGRW